MWENNLRSWKRVTTLFSSSFYYMLLVALIEKFCWSFVITVARIVLLLYARSCRSISGIESRPNVVVSNSDTGVDVLTASWFYPLPEPCSCNPDAGSILRFIFSLALSSDSHSLTLVESECYLDGRETLRSYEGVKGLHDDTSPGGCQIYSTCKTLWKLIIGKPLHFCS